MSALREEMERALDNLGAGTGWHPEHTGLILYAMTAVAQAAVDAAKAEGCEVIREDVLEILTLKAERNAALAQVGAMREALQRFSGARYVSVGGIDNVADIQVGAEGYRAAMKLAYDPAPTALARLKADAWDEGFKAGNDYAFDMVDKPDAVDPKRFDNPYRAEAQGADKGGTTT